MIRIRAIPDLVAGCSFAALYLQECGLTALTLSKVPDLIILYCYNNHLLELDISKTAMESIPSNCRAYTQTIPVAGVFVSDGEAYRLNVSLNNDMVFPGGDFDYNDGLLTSYNKNYPSAYFTVYAGKDGAVLSEDLTDLTYEPSYAGDVAVINAIIEEKDLTGTQVTAGHFIGSNQNVSVPGKLVSNGNAYTMKAELPNNIEFLYEGLLYNGRTKTLTSLSYSASAYFSVATGKEGCSLSGYLFLDYNQYYAGDIVAMNKIIEETEGFDWEKADPADGSRVPEDWEGKVVWDNNRVAALHLSALDITSNLNLRHYQGENQVIAITLHGNYDSYSAEIALNDPSRLVKGLSYANDVLTSNSKSITSSDIKIETGRANHFLLGTIVLTYVDDPIPATGIELNKSTLALETGKTSLLVATVIPDDATDKAIRWESSDEAVATVSATGLVTAISEGTATITVTTVDGDFTASCEVTVTNPVGIDSPEYSILVYQAGGRLYIDTPKEELVTVYTLTGKMLYQGKKQAGRFEIPVSVAKGEVLIVNGKKIFRK